MNDREQSVLICHRLAEVLKSCPEWFRVCRNVGEHCDLVRIPGRKILKIFKTSDQACFLEPPTSFGEDFFLRKFKHASVGVFLREPNDRKYDRYGNIIDEYIFEEDFENYAWREMTRTTRRILVRGMKNFFFACIEDKILPMDLPPEAFVVRGAAVFYIFTHRLHGFNWAINENARRPGTLMKRKKFLFDLKRQHNGDEIKILKGNQEEWEITSDNFSSARSLLASILDLLYAVVNFTKGGCLSFPVKMRSRVKNCGENCLMGFFEIENDLGKKIHSFLCDELFPKLLRYGEQNFEQFTALPNLKPLDSFIEQLLS